jgi:hypothetical protein
MQNDVSCKEILSGLHDFSIETASMPDGNGLHMPRLASLFFEPIPNVKCIVILTIGAGNQAGL